MIELHGLDRHPYGSWKSNDRLQRMWLRDFLPGDLPQARVLLYGYDARLKVQWLANNMESFTTTLRSSVERLRKTDEVRKSLIESVNIGDVMLTSILLQSGEAAADNLDCAWVRRIGDYPG